MFAGGDEPGLARLDAEPVAIEEAGATVLGSSRPSRPRMAGLRDTDEIQLLKAALAEREEQALEKERQLERYAADLRETFKQERARSQELRRSYVATVRALANAVEARDAYTGKHAERVAAYGIAIARAGGMSIADDSQIEFGFLLHDVGKVAVPDAILFKPEPLDGPERPGHGAPRGDRLGDPARDRLLGDAKLVVRHHHERWDGAGYPTAWPARTSPSRHACSASPTPSTR